MAAKDCLDDRSGAPQKNKVHDLFACHVNLQANAREFFAKYLHPRMKDHYIYTILGQWSELYVARAPPLPPAGAAFTHTHMLRVAAKKQCWARWHTCSAAVGVLAGGKRRCWRHPGSAARHQTIHRGKECAKVDRGAGLVVCCCRRYDKHVTQKLGNTTVACA